MLMKLGEVEMSFFRKNNVSIKQDKIRTIAMTVWLSTVKKLFKGRKVIDIFSNG
jgi:hypothetical protein